MPAMKRPVPRWEPLCIHCDAYDAAASEGSACTEFLERYDSRFHHLFLALRAKHPRLKEITIEGLHLLPEDAFYGTDILMEVEGSLLYPPLEEVSLLFYEAGIRHFT